MIITAIKAQVKHGQRVSIYVDGVYVFSLHHNQLLEQKLRVGQELTEARVVELRRISEFGKAYERTFQYVMLRPRSQREVADYCRRKQWAAGDCQAIIQKLTSRGYIDDRVFARAWVEQRLLTKPVSTRRLMAELKQKGVAEAVAQEALGASRHNDDDALRQLVAKKRRIARYAQDPQKLMQYLARQGFSYDNIKAVLADD